MAVIEKKRSRRTVAALTTVALLSAHALPAWAEPPVAPAPATSSVPAPATVMPPPVISPLRQNQPAPFSGVLLTPDAVAAIISQKDAAEKAAVLAVEQQRALDQAQLTFDTQQQASTCTADKSVLQAQVTDSQKQANILNDQLKKVGSAPSAPVWIGVGVLGGALLTLAVTFAVARATTK